jgi:hypothetical protein
MNTIDVLDGKRLVLDAEPVVSRSPSIRSPRTGAVNHVRSSPAAHEFYIRDVLLEWERDRVNELEIERLGPPPARPPSPRSSRSSAQRRTCGSG